MDLVIGGCRHLHPSSATIMSLIPDKYRDGGNTLKMNSGSNLH